MIKTRRLSDLYVVGKEFRFDDGTGDPVAVYIRKLSPVDNEQALRRCNAARARVLTSKNDPESSVYQDVFSQVYDVGDRDQLIEYLVAPDLVKKEQVLEAELSEESEWSDDNYLQGLKDAWAEELENRYNENPEDEEAKRVFTELKRFADMISELLKGEKAALALSYEDAPDEDLRQRVIVRFVELQADLEWMNEYRKCEIWLGTRDNANRRERYFGSRDEVDELSLEMFQRLIDSYRAISVEILEGKDSEETPSFSPQLEQPKPQATDDSSGPQAVNQ